MLQVMEFWMSKTGKRQKDFCEAIGIHQGNIPSIRTGKQSFQVHHIQAAMSLLGNGNYNYVNGVEPNMFRTEKKITAIQQLDQAVKRVKEEWKK